jgi:cell division GTPase FtsZ
MELQPNNVTIYASGGAGINIVGSLPQAGDQGLAKAMCYAIDTSKSNLRDSKFSADNLYLFPDVDGSGKVRAENHVLIAKNTKSILQKFKPSAFNIVVSSGGGGSGGVIAGSIVSELMSEDIPVISIVIGSTNSQIEVDNTIKTLKTYDAIAKKYGAPVVVHLLENSLQSSRKMIDAGAHSAIWLFSCSTAA